VSGRDAQGPVIYVDADGCPVKDEVYRVAGRYGLTVYVVSNRPVRTPSQGDVRPVVVGGAFDAADDWIAERAGPGTLVITADIPLAARCLEGGARVLGPRGNRFTPDNIGSALAGRELADQLRQMGIQTGGPKPFDKRDRSRFLQVLDQEIQAVRRQGI